MNADLVLIGALAADVLVIFGVGVMSLGVLGIFRMPDVYLRLHAASKSVFLGVISIVLASLATRDPAIIWRALLIGVLLLLTTPVAAHAIARAAFISGERLAPEDAVDESGKGLVAPDDGGNRESLLHP